MVSDSAITWQYQIVIISKRKVIINVMLMVYISGYMKMKRKPEQFMRDMTLMRKSAHSY